ncbi:hypothetical protein [cf. Phormidesmis sp. LEGE 11477]|uniref:hypothetical protein n=1 Tax=cf. Phormidesmis sp. LEGE 11477 TaxID=1828680 RepID=UPI00187F9845|nr:hypothetical protein [cf. Phormidesmis sp. LEGE 11477]MBE9063531.1 hypothetical protein [cf. Phormidesmis sp. LEGE 11477]
MKDSYDFSKGERGKFYNAQAEFSFPIHLEPDVNDQINRIAEKNGVDVQTLVNAWLRANLKMIESLQP